MSVELLDNPRFYGFRVRRQIDGKTYQEYFSLKENSKRLRGAKRAEIKAVADARDEELKVLQQKNRDKKDREIELDPSGQIRGCFVGVIKVGPTIKKIRATLIAEYTAGRLRWT